MSILRIAAVLVMASALVVAGEKPTTRVALSGAQVEDIISHTQAAFWGNAVGPDGQVLSPSNEAERERLLIPHADAVRVVNGAHVYGLALWCNLDWKPVYLKFMEAERAKGWNEKQIAFVGMLFGMTQAAVKLSVGGTCSAKDRSTIQKALDAELIRLTHSGDH
jgi:hypothetical protein